MSRNYRTGSGSDRVDARNTQLQNRVGFDDNELLNAKMGYVLYALTRSLSPPNPGSLAGGPGPLPVLDSISGAVVAN